MKKHELIAQAIKEVLDDKGWTVEYIEDEFPKKFLLEVSKKLPENLPFSNTTASLSVYVSRNRPEIFATLRRLYEDNPVNDTQTPLAEPKSQARIPTEEDISRIVNELINERLSDLHDIAHNEHTRVQLVPEPETIKGEGKGRRLTRDYERFSVTVDKELMKLFTQEVKQLKTTSPRLLDTILWERYGRPKLSFQVEEE